MKRPDRVTVLWVLVMAGVTLWIVLAWCAECGWDEIWRRA